MLMLMLSELFVGGGDRLVLYSHFFAAACVISLLVFYVCFFRRRRGGWVVRPFPNLVEEGVCNCDVCGCVLVV